MLAAGSSRRFGAADKLTSDFRGRPLGAHVIDAMPHGRFARKWVVASDPSHDCATIWIAAGFDVLHNSRASEGMGTSVALAAQRAMREGCDGLLVALADMPLVPAEHYAALADGLDSCEAIIASRDAAALQPPAIFGSAHFPRLARAAGDEGARRWLGSARALDCSPEWLIDIDTVEALDQHGQAGGHGLKAGEEGEEL
ncbi:nucleotidyltransferase family protein [Qipengyuania sp. ASV99]|uniref:nucleotidyltransferase family protein n=1 Tax=Qipengyuania sp. ASV99 TaxID=3399681 RepID=UPI003A4C71F1